MSTRKHAWWSAPLCAVSLALFSLCTAICADAHERAGISAFREDQRILAAPALLFIFYLIAWLRIGPEPKPGTVVTRYEPPDGLSAAAVRYVVTTGSDGRSFAAVIAALATRGCLRAEPTERKYKLSRLMSDRAMEAKLPPEEKRILTMLFEDGPEVVLTPSLDERNSAQNTRYVFGIQQELRKRLDGLYFTKHAGVIALGVLATVLAALWLAATARDATHPAQRFLQCGSCLSA